MVRAAKLREPTSANVTDRSGGTRAAAWGDSTGSTPDSAAPTSTSRHTTGPEPLSVNEPCSWRADARTTGPNAGLAASAVADASTSGRRATRSGTAVMAWAAMACPTWRLTAGSRRTASTWRAKFDPSSTCRLTTPASTPTPSSTAATTVQMTETTRRLISSSLMPGRERSGRGPPHEHRIGSSPLVHSGCRVGRASCPGRSHGRATAGIGRRGAAVVRVQGADGKWVTAR